MTGSTPIVSNSIPSTSTTYNAPYNTQYSIVSGVPFNQQYGWHPLYSSNPHIQISGGTSNIHILAGNVIVTPLFSGMHVQTLIDMNTPYSSQGHMVSSVADGNPQGGPNQSMGAPYSQPQMIQGGTTYPGGISIPQHHNPNRNPH